MTNPAVTRLIRRLVNGAWIASCAREHARFAAALKQVEVTQQELLLNLLQRNADTKFGRQHGFAGIRRVEEYQARVPIAGYDAYAGAIEAIARGEQNVLTQDRVERFQLTSGSTSAAKLIPWTASAAAEFRRSIAAFFYALYRRQPALLRGSSYWALSPPGTHRKTVGDLAVGFDRDSSYLGFFGEQLFNLVSAVPAQATRATEIDLFRDQTLAALLADDGLSFVSIWSPTFLTLLLGHFLARREKVLKLIADHGGRRARARADELRRLTAAGQLEPGWLSWVWPNLRVISCWNTGPSEIYAARLQALFPRVEIHGKGLIAAEAFVSLPFAVGHDPVAAVRSHFLEFQNLDDGTVHLAHQLARGQTYRVIVTTGSGLYRYSIGDLLQVTGFLGEAPCLRFIGREGNISDHFGEKLTGWFVQQAVARSLEIQRISASFFLLAPVIWEEGERYVLFLETARQGSDPASPLRSAVEGAAPASAGASAGRPPAPLGNVAATPVRQAQGPEGARSPPGSSGSRTDSGNVAGLADVLERLLEENPHYDHCRHLGQLAPCLVFLLDPAGPDGATCYHDEMLARGRKLGEIKLAPLDSHSGWELRFRGRFLP